MTCVIIEGITCIYYCFPVIGVMRTQSNRIEYTRKALEKGAEPFALSVVLLWMLGCERISNEHIEQLFVWMPELFWSDEMNFERGATNSFSDLLNFNFDPTEKKSWNLFRNPSNCFFSIWTTIKMKVNLKIALCCKFQTDSPFHSAEFSKTSLDKWCWKYKILPLTVWMMSTFSTV